MKRFLCLCMFIVLTITTIISTAVSISAASYLEAANGIKIWKWVGGFDGEGPEKLFDYNETTKWCHNSAVSNVIWEMPTAVEITGYQMVTANDNDLYNGRNPDSWVLFGSNDYNSSNGTGTWKKIHFVSNDKTLQDVNYTSYIFELSQKAPAYKFYQLQISKIENSDTFQLSGFNLIYDGQAAQDVKWVTDNHWNVLALIYENVNAPGFKKSFTDKEVEELQRVLAEFPDAVKNLSDSRMIIDTMDVKVIDTPVRSVSGGSGDFTTGQNGDINFDAYLEGKDYQQIVVYAPLTGSPNFNGWAGLGGTWYEYDGQKIYYLTISMVLDIGEEKYNVRGGTYDSDTSCLLHEMLHCVETNSSFFRNWSGFTPVHNNADHGYVSDALYGWLDWYSALMRDDGLNGKGFKPDSFLVDHRLSGFADNTASDGIFIGNRAPAETDVWKNPFSDVVDSRKTSVRYVTEAGIMTEASRKNNKPYFSGSGNITVGDFVQSLAEMADVAVELDNSSERKEWAKEHGLIDDKTNLNRNCNVQTACAIVRKYLEVLESEHGITFDSLDHKHTVKETAVAIKMVSESVYEKNRVLNRYDLASICYLISGLKYSDLIAK